MYRYIIIVLAVALVAGFASNNFAGMGTQDQDRIQAKDGTGVNCPCDGVCDNVCDGDGICDSDCDGIPDQLQQQDKDQDQAQDGTCDGTGPDRTRTRG